MEEVILWIGSFLITCLFLCNAWLCAKFIGFWLNPASIISSFWFIVIVIPLFIGFYAPVNPLAILFILIWVIVFTLPIYMFDWRYAVYKNKVKINFIFLFESRFIVCCFLFLVLVCLVSYFFDLLSQGFKVADFKSVISIASAYTNKRYSDELNITVFSKLAVFTSFPVVMLGGLIYGAKKRRTILFFSFLPSFFALFFQSAKGLLFVSAFLFIGGILVTSLFRSDFRLVKGRINKRIVMLGFVVILSVIVSFLSRGLDKLPVEQMIDGLIRYLTTYSSGHLFAFSDWFDYKIGYPHINKYHDIENGYSYGMYTFMSIFKLFGRGGNIPLGIYDEFYSYGDYIFMTNIYTIFRGMILDFGFLGSVLFSLFLGYCFTVSFYRLLVNQFPSFHITLFVFFIGAIYQSYLISSLSWLSLPVSIFFVSFVLYMAKSIYFLKFRMLMDNR
ncbi:O-antigen ligase [Plesiomonas shigelloides]|uniref:O-antigen polymerase n=1 Tax=Plesiomonas shigelloides TaxID=703 RepID=UPI003138E0FA